MEILAVILGIVSLIAIPWFVIHIIGRINENLSRAKTLRRMNDFSNVYWDYNHNIWVTKQTTVAENQKCD